MSRWQRKNLRHYHRQQRAASDQATMQAGPFLLNEHTLVIPSAWYNEDAVRIWSAQGFHYNRTGRQWLRDTRKPLRGRRYTADAWLQSARQHFYRLYPKAATYCIQCEQEFVPISSYQTVCAECAETGHYHTEWR